MRKMCIAAVSMLLSGCARPYEGVMISKELEERPDPLYRDLISSVAPSVPNSLVSHGGADHRGVNRHEYFWKIGRSDVDYRTLYTLMGSSLTNVVQERAARLDALTISTPIVIGGRPPFHRYFFSYSKGNVRGVAQLTVIPYSYKETVAFAALRITELHK